MTNAANASGRGAEQFCESDKASHNDLGAGIHWAHIGWLRSAEPGTPFGAGARRGSVRAFAPESEIASSDSGAFGWAFALAAGVALVTTAGVARLAECTAARRWPPVLQGSLPRPQLL